MGFIKKKSFTLIELIIVVLIVFLSYFLIFSNNSFDMYSDKFELNLSNLKEYLLDNFDFEDELSFFCIQNGCYVKVDGTVLEDKKYDIFFSSEPLIYEYNKDEIKVEFNQEKINNISFDVLFEFKIDRDYKSSEFIVELQNRVLVFNSLFEKPFIYESLQEVFEGFKKKQEEVKNAF